MWAAVLAALVATAAAETLTETAPGADGQPATYPVTSDAYLQTAASVGIETAYTLTTGASDTTFTFLVRAYVSQGACCDLLSGCTRTESDI
jgi:hypothetical protein